MKILIVCSEPPFPANHGGRLDVMQKIIALHELKYEIDIIFVGNSIDDDICENHLKKYSTCIYKVDRNKGILHLICSFLRLWPYQIFSRKGLNKINIGQKVYDITILESEYVYTYLNKNLKSSIYILRVHNDEVKYFKGLMKASRIKNKLYYFIESFLFRIRKRQIYNSFSDLWFISQDEFSNNSRSYNCCWIPPNMPIVKNFNQSKYDFVKNPKLLFVGNLFTPNNLEGVIWFLDNVYPKLISKYPSLCFTIAGNCKNGVDNILQNKLEQFKSCNLKLVQSPSDNELNELYDSHTIFINPMLNGAGVKLKVIDAIRNSFAVVSTTVGIEGTGLIIDEHYKLADSPESFYGELDTLINNNELSNEIAYRAFLFVKQQFDIKSKIDSRINKLLEINREI